MNEPAALALLEAAGLRIEELLFDVLVDPRQPFLGALRAIVKVVGIRLELPDALLGGAQLHRKLVRELSRTLMTSVEMRQIGVRDEAKLMDGHGRCGYRLCCAAWMQEFEPVSIKLAKHYYEQALSYSKGESAGLFVSYGEAICVQEQDREQFKVMMNKALSVKTGGVMNRMAKRRARWLLKRIDDLFL